VRIAMGRGVCGTAAAEQRTLVVPDVEQFPGHIACDAGSRSEIVVPIVRGDRVVGVLDVDSYELAAFDATDAEYLGQVARLCSSFAW
jgi:GAF domain-containing protein